MYNDNFVKVLVSSVLFFFWLKMTEDICPRLTSTKVLIQATETENLEINVVNLVRYVRT